MVFKVDVRVTGPEKYIVCKRVRQSFSPDILQPEAVKGLRTTEYYLKKKFSGSHARRLLKGHAH